MIHVINLAHREDRRKHIAKMMRNMGIKNYEYYSAVNGRRAFPEVKRRNMQGHLGCRQSHINLLTEKGVHCNDEWFIVMEDDCMLSRDFTLDILDIVPSDCALVYFGGNKVMHPEAIEPYNEQFDQALNVYCTHAYAIRVTHIPDMLAVLNSRPDKVDVLFTDFQKLHLSLITTKCYAWQMDSMSDITNCYLSGKFMKY